MMQYVATAKSDVAALGTDIGMNTSTQSDSNQQFDRLLQEQKTSYSAESSKPVESKEATAKHADPSTDNSTDKDLQKSQPNVEKNSRADNPEPVERNATSKVIEKGQHSTETVEEVTSTIGEEKARPSQIALDDKEFHQGSDDVYECDVIVEDWLSFIEKLAGIGASDKTEVKATKTPEKLLVEETDKSQIDEDTLVENGTKQNLTEFVLQILKEAQEDVAVNDVESNDIKQSVAERLLNDPDTLKKLLDKLGLVSANVSVVANDGQLQLDTVPEETPSLNAQQIETDDLSLTKDIELLRVLLTEPVSSNKDIDVDLDPSVDAEIQVKQIDTVVDQLVAQEELIEQDVKAEKVEKSPSSEAVRVDSAAVKNNDIKILLNLPEHKLDKVLENLSQRLLDNNQAVESNRVEHTVSQIVNPKVADVIGVSDLSSKNFIAALKSGLEEFKSQLSQGREPGIDLKALVSDALAKATDTKAPVNVDQVVTNVSQMLDFSQTMHRAIEHHQDQTYQTALRDASQIQLEQSKQIQLNQSESKFDKAINLAKPEGHQQLAEKVRWMVNTKNLVAEIRLDPAELGSVNVKVAVSGDSATVNFVVQSQQARDAVDNASPKLKEMLAEKGIELGQSSVRQESDGQHNQGESERKLASFGDNAGSEEADVPEQVLVQQNIVNGALGGIDYFV